MATLYPLKEVPSSIETLVRASLTGLKRPGKKLPEKGYTIQGLTIDKKQFKEYCEMFGFDNNTVPSTYWYVRLFSLRSLLLAHPDAPFPMPGLVHLYDSIRQYDKIYPSDQLDVTCKFGRLLQHDKGTAVEIVTALTRNGETVWEEVNVNLYMGKKGLGDAPVENPAIELTAPDTSAEWELGESLGWQYAKVSGDFNPIHLHTIGAKLFGFPKHLIHGWYSVNRAIAPVQEQLAAPHELFVSFKKPLYLPGKVVSRTQQTEEGLLFDVIDAKEGFPNLKGYIRKI